jgi:hypothetical protein
MKSIKLLVFITLIAFAKPVYAQTTTYCRFQYWDKATNLDTKFFEILNANYNAFMRDTAPQWKYYDYKDYNDIYVTIVRNLKKDDFVITVDEANQMSWRNQVVTMPGETGEKGRSKKSTDRAKWILFEVLRPSLQQFAKVKL